jgi:hypothetical protein
MSFGVNFGLALEVIKVDGTTVKSLGSVNVPAKTAAALSASGGEGMRLHWADMTKANPEVVADAAMTVLPALKGSLG